MRTTTYLKTYSDLILLPTFEERFEYLKLNDRVGHETFGYNRYMNQALYQSLEWKNVRDSVILRDNGCDLGIPGREIRKHLSVHHIIPLTVEDILTMSDRVFDTNNLICVSLKTHNAIHFSDSNAISLDFVERKPNNTCPWR